MPWWWSSAVWLVWHSDVGRVKRQNIIVTCLEIRDHHWDFLTIWPVLILLNIIKSTLVHERNLSKSTEASERTCQLPVRGDAIVRKIYIDDLNLLGIVKSRISVWVKTAGIKSLTSGGARSRSSMTAQQPELATPCKTTSSLSSLSLDTLRKPVNELIVTSGEPFFTCTYH